MSTLRVDSLQGQTTGTDRYVVQVVSSNLTSHFNSNSQTFHDITGLSLSITPASTNNKVLIMVNMYASGADTTFFRLVRDSTAIAVGTDGSDADHRGFSMQRESATNLGHTHGVTFLDTPNTTSATTYKVQARNDASAYYFINRRESDTTFGLFSSITAMEIAQ